MDQIIAVDAYNGCELWARKIPHVFLGWSSYAWRRTHGVGGAASGGTSKVLHSMSADDENLYLNFGEVCYALDAQTGRQKKVYGSFRTGERYPLLKPQSFEMALEKDVAGTIKLKSTSTELELTLTTPPPKPRRPRDTDDHWDLFFDFRPPLERGNLYEPGVLQIKVNLPELKWENVVGPDRPTLAVTGKKSPVGNEVVVTLPWEGIASLAGARPKSFGFAAILNRWDGRTRTMQRKRGMRLSLAALDRFHKFADDKAYAFNNGWATFVLGAEGSRAARPAAPGGKLADLPKRALEWGRMPRRGKGHTFFAAGRRHPLSGQMTRRTYVRAKHCGARIASSATMDFFRSGTVGLYDLADDSGTRSFGGIRPGCHPNMIPAFGILIYSEASSGCRCAYNVHTSFALVPARKRKNEDWAVFHTFPESSPTLKQAALNLGAPGDRRDERGVLWLGYPRPEGEWRTWRGKYRMSLPVPIHLETSEGLGAYRFNSDRLDIRGTERPWIYASGYRGIKRAVLETPAGGSQAELRSYTVRLHFAEPDDAKPGERVLDVKLQGKTVLANLDVVKAAGGPNRALVREFKNVPVKENLTLELIGRTKAPTILSGIEVALE